MLENSSMNLTERLFVTNGVNEYFISFDHLSSLWFITTFVIISTLSFFFNIYHLPQTSTQWIELTHLILSITLPQYLCAWIHRNLSLLRLVYGRRSLDWKVLEAVLTNLNFDLFDQIKNWALLGCTCLGVKS